MAIEYHLVKGALDPIKGRHTARVETGLAINVDGMLSLLRTFNSTVSEEEAKSVIIAFQKTIGFYLKEGYGVDMGFMTLAPRVSGVFENENDSFDKNRHKIGVRARLDRSFVNEIRENALIQKSYRPGTGPSVSSVFDVTGGFVANRCLPGGTVQLLGKNLKFDLNNPKDGIYFLDSANVETRVDPFFVERHSPSALEFEMPMHVPPGEYRIEVHVNDGDDENIGRYKTPVIVETLRPFPLWFMDETTGLKNESVTAGGSVRLTGLDLDYGADPTEGVFFVDSVGGETRVPDTNFTQKTAKLLVFTAPALAAGDYSLEVRKLHSATLTSGGGESPLTVGG